MFNRLHRSIFFLIIGAVLALAGCGGGSQAGDASPAAQEPTPEKATNVVVAPVAAEDLRESFTLPGTLEAWEDLTLAAEMSGPVRWIGPKEGDRVKKGEPILRIDPDTVSADLSRDRADFELRRRDLARMRELLDQKFVSQQEFEQARRAFEMAEAEVKRSRVALEKSTLYAPVDGILDRLFVDRGEYVAEGAPLASIVQVDRLKVLVEVPEKDVPFLKTADRVQVLPAVIQGEPLAERTGEIIHLAYKADPVTRTYLAKVAVDNGERDLRPGMIVRVGLTRRELPGVIAVPLYAVIDRNGEKVVFVEENGTARLRPVSVGAVLGGRIVIQDGLQEGERLIVQGQQLLTDGAQIKIQDSGFRSQVSGNLKSEPGT